MLRHQRLLSKKGDCTKSGIVSEGEQCKLHLALTLIVEPSSIFCLTSSIFHLTVICREGEGVSYQTSELNQEKRIDVQLQSP